MILKNTAFLASLVLVVCLTTACQAHSSDPYCDKIAFTGNSAHPTTVSVTCRDGASVQLFPLPASGYQKITDEFGTEYVYAKPLGGKEHPVWAYFLNLRGNVRVFLNKRTHPYPHNLWVTVLERKLSSNSKTVFLSH